jgi:hypothetical protein
MKKREPLGERKCDSKVRVEIFFPPEGIWCTFEPAFNVPYRLVHTGEAPVQTVQEALDWAWRYANIVHQGDPWIKTGLRSAMVGDVFLVNGEAHAVMMVGFERCEFQREEDVLILHGQQSRPPIPPPAEPLAGMEQSNAERKKKKGKGQG